MATSTRKASKVRAKQTVQQKVQSELAAIDTAFKRISKNSAETIRFLSKAGIVTKSGRLAKAYR